MGNLQASGPDSQQDPTLLHASDVHPQNSPKYLSSSASPQRYQSKDKPLLSPWVSGSGVASAKVGSLQRSTFTHNSHTHQESGINIANLKSTFRNSQVFNQGSTYDHSWRIPSSMFVAGNSPNQAPQFASHAQQSAAQKQQFTVQWVKHHGHSSPKAKQPLVIDSFGGQTTLPMYTADSSQSQNTWQGNQVKMIRVYVDKDIEFNIPIPHTASDQLTCGWLLSEVTRRYIEALTKIKAQSTQTGGIKKYTRKMIVALKTTDQRESLDFWLTQYDRTLEVLQDGDFLIAHFAKLREARRPSIDGSPICKEDFEQIKVIGRGGFSRVVLARKKDTGRLYAVKIMKKARIIREKKLKPILSERSILEILTVKHPFIIKLHWAFQSRDELFFVMDVCTGGELFYHLSKHKRLGEKAAKFYFAEILLGLEHLHSHNIVYRDIKPENILLDIDGHVRIADFGLSKIIPPKHKSYSFCGSPEYMSPEMLACTGHDKRLDIYCLGALLFEMLTGLPPFYSRDDTQGMYERIMIEEVSLPLDLQLSDPPLLSSLLSRLMQKDPARRYQTLQEVKKHPWLADVPWQALLDKRSQPPILPSVRESHIDPDYTELPLDFEEDSHLHRGRLSTAERRYSYYYESTLQSKKSLAGGNGEQFSQFFANDSRVQHGASIQSDNSLGGPGDQPLTIENFTFIDVPREELEVLRTLKHKTQHQRMMVINPDQIQRRREKSVRAANQQDTAQILIAEDEGASRNHVVVNGATAGIIQTASNGSIITFYDESNQSIAQEFMVNEGAAHVFPTGQPQTVGAILEVTNDDQLFEKYDEMFPPQQQRLTIDEVEDDESAKGSGSLRSDLSSLKLTEEITKNVSPVQVEKQIVLGKAINFKDNPLFQTLKNPVNIESLAKSNNSLNLMMTSTFQMRTPNNMKAASTIVSPKLSLTTQTPSKETIIKKIPALVTAVSSTNHTGRKVANTDSKGTSLQQQSVSVRESFTKDKHIFSSDNSSEIAQPKGVHSQFYYKHHTQSSSSPRKPPAVNKKKIPLHSTGSTARVPPQSKLPTKLGLPTTHYKPANKTTGKSFLKAGTSKQQYEELQVPTTTECNQDEDEYTGSAVKGKLTLKTDYAKGEEQQRSMKFKSIEAMTHPAHTYKSPGQKTTSIQVAYHTVKSAGTALAVGQSQQQYFQTFQRLLFQGGNGQRQAPGNDMSQGDNEHNILQNPQMFLNNPAKLYQSLNHLGVSMTTNKKLHLDQSSKLAQTDDSANKSSLVMGTAPHQQHMSPGGQQSHGGLQRRCFESSFDKSKPQTKETHEYLIGNLPNSQFAIPQFLATHSQLPVKVIASKSSSHQKPATYLKAGINSNVFQTPKSSLSSKLFLANMPQNSQQKTSGVLLGTPNNQSMIATAAAAAVSSGVGSANGRRRHMLGNTQSQLNINVINSGNTLITTSDAQQRKGRDQSTRYSKMSRNAGNSMKANTAKAISSSRIQ